MSRFKVCIACSGGSHGHCLIHNCQCPLSACEQSRIRGVKGERLMANKGYLPQEFERMVTKEVKSLTNAQNSQVKKNA